MLPTTFRSTEDQDEHDLVQCSTTAVQLDCWEIWLLLSYFMEGFYQSYLEHVLKRLDFFVMKTCTLTCINHEEP